jgi:uncharacterized protein (TIGR03118 family)
MFRATRRRPTPLSSVRPRLEVLEERCLLSGNVLQTNLVSDLPGVAAVTDPNLVNPWGISESPTTPTRPGSPFWISDNNAGVSSLYNVPGPNNTPVAINQLVVNIPTPTDPTGGTPTGTVFDIAPGSNAFQITGLNPAGKTTSAKAVFLFATEDGTLVGWNPGIDPTRKFAGPNGISAQAVIAKDNSGNNFTEPDPAKQTGAVYKGLAIASSAAPIFTNDPSSTTVLYATNFRSGQVEVYDTGFTRVTLPMGAFTDPKLPRGYAPFNVQVLGDKVYVTYAKQDATKHDDVAGPGHGFVDVYNLDGTGLQRLVTRGPLDSPWGLAIAPAGFAGITAPNNHPVLLVGNFGNGFINAFDSTNGNFLGQLKDPDGEPIQIDGLWALKVGNGGNGGDPNAVYFTAGLFGETHGLFGSLTNPVPGAGEGQAEAQAVTADLDVFQMALATVQNDVSSGVTGSQLRQDLQALNTAFRDLALAEIRFAVDARADLSPGGHHGDDMSMTGHAHGQDALDSFFADLGNLQGNMG